MNNSVNRSFNSHVSQEKIKNKPLDVKVNFDFKEEVIKEGTQSGVPANLSNSVNKINKSINDKGKKNKIYANNNTKTKEKSKVEIQKEKYDQFIKEEKEKKINERIKEYELQLNNELCQMLVEEREKEDERIMLVNNCKDEKEKKRLEKILSMEKADANEQIIEKTK